MQRVSLPKNSVRFLFLLLLLLVSCAGASVYYIDFEGGSDKADGRSARAAFKHCPGDPAAEEKASGLKLLPGDKIIFKGGVIYRGSVTVVCSGEDGSPVVYDGNTEGTFGTGRAVVDGSEPVTGWSACVSEADCGGNPQWKNIFTARLPPGVEPLTANLFEDDRMLAVAQEPNLKDFLYSDDLATYRKIPPGQATETTLTDPQYLTQKGEHDWDQAILLIWAEGNRVFKSEVTAFDPRKHQLTYKKLPVGLYKNRDTPYALANNLRVLDRPGEYVVEKENDGQGRVYLWPLSGGDLNKKMVTVSVRPYGFDLADKAHITFQNFIVQKQSGLAGHPAGFFKGPGKMTSGINIRGNVVRWVRAPLRSSAVMLSDVEHSLVDGNEVYENVFCSGLILSGFNDSTASNNILRKNGSTALDFYRCHRSKMLGNIVTDNNGVHGNGLTVYVDSEDILIFGNKVFNSNIAFTCQKSKNLTLAYNLLINTPARSDGSSYVAADWGNCENVKYFNNVIFQSGGGFLPAGNKFPSPGCVIKNNICVGTRLPPGVEASNNIYTSAGTAKGKLETGSRLVLDLKTLFVDPDKNDFHLKAGSPAIGAGVPAGFSLDLDGRPVPAGKAPCIGAYEYK